MGELSPKNIIKDFILENREKFELAFNVYNNFLPIVDDMLKAILEGLVNHINTMHNLQLQLRDFGRQANNYWFRFSINSELFFEFGSSYFFKTYAIRVHSATGPFDPDKRIHVVLRREMKKEFKDVSEENWYISGIKNVTYEMNIGESYLALFDVFKNIDLQQKLQQNFGQVFGDIITKIIDIINNN